MAKRGVLDVLHREIRGLHEAAYLLAFFTFGSQVFALVRDRLLAHTFGVGQTLDVFYAAFRIPDTLYALIASMVSLFVLIPFLEEAQRGPKGAVRRFLSDMLSFFGIALALAAAIAWVYAPQITALLYKGFPASFHAELVPLVRILLLQPIILGVSNLLSAYVQVTGRFLLYAVAPMLYNVGIIIGILVFYPVLGVSGLAWGVVLGALFHLGVQSPYIIASGVWPRFVLPAWHTVRKVVRISIPRTITLSAQQLVLLALVSLASYFAVGSVSSFTLAWNLQGVPLAIIGVSYSVAAFPKLARLFGNGDLSAYRDTILIAARQIIFWALPAAVFVIVLRAQIVRVILGSGAFDWDATRVTGAVLALLAVSLVAQSLVVLLVRACYAAGRTRVPLVLNVTSSVLTVGAAFGLLWAAQAGYFDLGHFAQLMRLSSTAGAQVLLLALAYSIGSLVNMALLLGYFEREFAHFLRGLARTAGQALIASGAAGFGAYLALRVLDDIVSLRTVAGVAFQGAGAGLIGLVIWMLVLVGLGSRDITAAWWAIHRRITARRLRKAQGSIEGA